MWPLNRLTVSGADSLKIGIAYFETIGLFDYAEFQETNSGDSTDGYCQDNLHMADFFLLTVPRNGQ